MDTFMRVGIFGGSFDPLHHGHLILAELAAETLHLDRVLFVPVACPPHKQGRSRESIENRLEMIRLSIADNDRFQLSMADVDRPPPHYSVYTVDIIRNQYPNSELYFMMGGDSLRNLMSWYKPDVFVQKVRLAVMRRPSSSPVTPTMHDIALPGLSERIAMIEAPPIGISSTRIVEQISAGKSIRYLVPGPVYDYINEHDLYKRV